MIRLAANLGMLWPQLPLFKRMEAAARAGFRAVEMHFPYEVPPQVIRAASQELDLVLLGINSPPGEIARGELGLAALPGRESAFKDGVGSALDYAAVAGARALHVMAGNVSQWSRASCSDVFTRNLCWAADQALTFGITLLLEPLNEANHPDYFYHTIEEAAVALRYIARPNVKLQFDTYHVGMQGGDTVGALHRHWPLIGHVQIASVPDRGEPKCSDSDIVEVMHAVDSLGYNGWIGCEYRPRDDTDAGLGWIAQLSLSTSSQ